VVRDAPPTVTQGSVANLFIVAQAILYIPNMAGYFGFERLGIGSIGHERV
jgi:hypothetical protein